MLKELIEQEILSRGNYQIIDWNSALEGWCVKTLNEKGYYTYFYVDDIINEILKRELK